MLQKNSYLFNKLNTPFKSHFNLLTLTEVHNNSTNVLYTEKEDLDASCTDIYANTPLFRRVESEFSEGACFCQKAVEWKVCLFII